MTSKTAKMKVEMLDNYLSHTCQDYGERDHEAMMMASKALEQLDIIRGIVSKSEYPREDVIRYKMICDVLGVEHV
jgi:hypothetical protein